MSEVPVRSEKLLQAHNTGEHNEIPAVQETSEAAPGSREHGPDAGTEQARQHDNLEAARQTAQEQAISAAESTSLHAEQSGPVDQSHSFAVHQQLKTNAYAQTLRTIQRRLPRAEQAFSKVIHNRRVEAASEFAAKSVARPSGILGGAICAFIGSALLVYLTRHYGFVYNYTMFILFFVGGFGVGLLAELVVRLIRRHP